MKGDKQKMDTTKENVANMLPIVPIDGSTLTKNENNDSLLNNEEDNSEIVRMINNFNNAIEEGDELAIENAVTDLSTLPNYQDIMMESVLKDEEDIFYNRIKFENGDTNLLFIVGYSGGGKSTMSGAQKKAMREVVDMDQIVLNMSKDDEFFKNLGTFAYQFVTGPGKKYRCEGNETVETLKKMDVVSYRPKISKDLFKFATKYASSHKTTKLIMEGVWIYRYVEPSEAKTYAVYIKGTSLKTATQRALKRDRANGTDGKNPVTRGLHTVGKLFLGSGDAISSALSKWQKYYKHMYEAQKEVEYYRVSKSASNKVKGIAHDIKNGALKDDAKIIKHTISDSYKYSRAQAKKAKKKIMKESAEAFLNNEITIREFDSVIEESVKDKIINLKTNVEISRKLRLLVLDIAELKAFLKTTPKSGDTTYYYKYKGENLKINDVKKLIIEKEKEKRKLCEGLSNEALQEVKRIEKEAMKQSIDEWKELDEWEKAEREEEKKEAEKAKEVEESAKDKDKEDDKPEKKTVKFKKPKKCKYCDSTNIKIRVIGEPVFVCGDCGRYLGDVPFSATESVDDSKDDDKKEKTLPPELKRLDETRGKISDIKDKIEDAQKRLDITGEEIYEKKIKGLTAKLEKLEKDLKEDEAKVKKLEKEFKESANYKELKKEELDDMKSRLNQYKREYLDLQGGSGLARTMSKPEIISACANLKMHILDLEDSIKNFKMESVISEAANMEDEIKPLVEKLNALGYTVKYASPGHEHLRKKEDNEPDGVYYGKLYSDARVMFDDKYDFPDTPKYWHLREVDGCSYLDITPYKYNEEDGTPDEAFKKWKENYMASLKEFVDFLGDYKSKKVEESYEDVTFESLLEEACNNFNVEL